jgi:hypothetical protein
MCLSHQSTRSRPCEARSQAIHDRQSCLAQYLYSSQRNQPCRAEAETCLGRLCELACTACCT